MSLQEQRSYAGCTPRRSLQLCQLPLLTYSGVSYQKYQHTCNPTPTTTKRENCDPGRDPSPLSNTGRSRTDGRPAFWSALITISFIAQCFAKRLAICRTSYANPYCPSAHPSGKNEEYEHQRQTLRAIATPKLSESSSVPCYETGKAISYVIKILCWGFDLLTSAWPHLKFYHVTPSCK